MTQCSQCKSSRPFWQIMFRSHKAWSCPACGQRLAYSKIGILLSQAIIPGGLYAFLLAKYGLGVWYLFVPCLLLGGMIAYFAVPVGEVNEV